MFCLAIPLAVCVAHGLLAAQDTLPLTVSRASIPVGDTVTITWALRPGERGYLSMVGAVRGRGSRTFSLSQPTSFFLLRELPGSIAIDSATVQVRDAKGNFPPEDDARFQYPISCDVPSSHTRVALLDRIHAALQDSLHLSVNEYSKRSGHYVFITSPVRSLVESSPERRIRFRRAAFRIVVGVGPPSASRIPCTVSSMIEAQRSGEDAWHLEADERFFVSLESRFNRMIRR
jgi:hypothetical protein